MSRPHRRPLLATVLLAAALLLSACGAATPAPDADPATEHPSDATFDGATFDTSTWR